MAIGLQPVAACLVLPMHRRFPRVTAKSLKARSALMPAQEGRGLKSGGVWGAVGEQCHLDGALQLPEY